MILILDEQNENAEKVNAVDYIKGLQDGKEIGYQKAIDDYYTKIISKMNISGMLTRSELKEIAEQLKEQKNG